MRRTRHKTVVSCVCLMTLLGSIHLGVAAVVTAAAKPADSSAGVTGISVNPAADTDADGHIAAGQLNMRLDTVCVGCYDSNTLLDDPEMEPVVTIAVNESRVATIEVNRDENTTIKQSIGTVVNVVDRRTASIEVTLHDRDWGRLSEIDSQTMVIDVESPSADQNANSTTASAPRGLPPTGETRQTTHFRFRHDGLDRCGPICAEATGTVWTHDNATATNVSVKTQLRAGTTEFWSHERTIGTLSSNERQTTTQRVNPQFSALSAISRSDGRVALIVSINSTNYHEIIAYERNVSVSQF
ncbi:MAG: hypothetical protein J07HQW2_02144 [Haloquadratum walsbyi J07HQW2]|uniref:Uncharacterized protein n=2 Tax=Haloquadratum walsbyi TaxID=293091 RepID=U1MYU5_9EURY|nr:MAG: hypothetical protein J07HQW2_02144 [Haloquadratum walsbyi J07HQW2]